MRQRVALPAWAHTVAAIVALVLASISLTVSLVDSDGDGRPDTVDVTVNAAPGDGQPTRQLEVPAPAVDQARQRLDHQQLATAPQNAPPPDAQAERKADRVEKQVNKLPTAGAVQGFRGCSTRIIGTNYSSRNGARATWQVMHYTVSPNRPGWSDVNAIISLFSNPGRQASSNFVIDSEGHCAYIVPIEAKAWTQAGGNPWSVSYEIVATGTETAYLAPAGWAKLKSIVHQVAARTRIPLSRGAVSGSCTPVRAGIVQHKDFGLCGGGHVDITPFSIDQVIRLVAAPAKPPSPLTKTERKIRRGSCRPNGSGHTARYWRHRARTRVRHLDATHRNGRPWRYHQTGARRRQLAQAAAGKC